MSLKDKNLIKKWRLILGNSVDQNLKDYGMPDLTSNEVQINEALSSIYDETTEGNSSSSRSAGLGKSNPLLVKWLGNIRKLFPENIVTIIQKDAVERKGLKELLLEPELLKTIKPDISMVNLIMTLKNRIPEKSKDVARELIKELVEDLKNKLTNQVSTKVRGALNKKQRTILPNVNNIDWKRTIQRNIKHYNTELKKIIPEKFYFFSKANKTNDWKIILDVDQSGSMGESVIYSSIMASILASIPSLDTKVVCFDTTVVDYTEVCKNDPVDMLFGIQLGGGTDISKSLQYCSQFITEPNKTIFILISDLYEGGNISSMISQLKDLKESGVNVIALLTLSDGGKPNFNHSIAEKIAGFGIPSFACSPNKFADLLVKAINKQEIVEKKEFYDNKD